MKISTIALSLLLLTLAGCEKEIEPKTKPVDFSATTYETLGTFDSNGRPNYLEKKDVISSNLMAFIKKTLPERQDLRKVNTELLSSKAIADITVTKTADIFVTFISHGAAEANAFAFYTYPTNNPPASSKDIKKIIYIFPNSGNGTPLVPGDKVKIGRFNPGTSVGFVLMPASWNKTTGTIGNNTVHFCSNDVLNPEVDPSLKKHAVLINYTPENKIIIGFEDVDRTSNKCDHDFNDALLYTTVSGV